MTRQARGLAAAFVLVLAVILLAGQLVREQSEPAVASTPTPMSAASADPDVPVPTPSAAPTSSASPVVAGAPSATASPPPTEPSALDPARLGGLVPLQVQGTVDPDRSVHVAARYLQHYGATRVTWDELLDRGSALPPVSPACTRSWNAAGLDARINRNSASYLCLSGLVGRGFKPQGVGGSGTTEGSFWLGTALARDRNIVITSWYAKSGVTKLLAIDLDRSRYNTVELVRPASSRTFRKLSSHGSGLVWAGHYLYSSSLSELMMYNAGDILRYDGKYVLPAISRWRLEGRGGMSSISIDRTAKPNQLQSINYTKRGATYLQSFALAADGSLAANPARRSNGLALVTTLGADKGRVIHNIDTLVVPGQSFQGVASVDAYDLANSSSMRINGRKGDTAVVLKDRAVVGKFRMPRGNGQSIYLDYARKRFVSVTEAGSQFLYVLPLAEFTN